MLLTTPIWLLALAAISIPIVIHLWNIKPGKTLKVGSIALFTASSPASSRSFKLLDILLLLVRCLLLIILAFLLAAPVWQQHKSAQKSKGWVLVPRSDFKESYQKFQPKIDSLSQAGYEFHLFEKDFSRQDLNEFKSTVAADTAGKLLNYWPLIKQLADKVPGATPVEIFTPNTITHFNGEKPASGLRINWHTYTPADSVAIWPADAWMMANGNIRVLQGVSNLAGTNYQYIDIVNRQNSAYHLTVDNGLPYVSLDSIKIPVDTTTTQIAIYADKGMPDANYLKAALQAIQQLTGRNTVIKIYSDANAIPAGQDWIYWLSDKPVNIAKAKNLFIYEPGKQIEINSWISNTQPHTITQGQPKIAMYKTVTTKKNEGELFWTDGFGNPILIKQQNTASTTFHFYSRFNPAWTDLVWNNEFPKWLLALTHPANVDIGKHDRRILSDEQLQPTIITDGDKTPANPANYIYLTHYLWLALLIAFIVERWLATKNKTILTHG